MKMEPERRTEPRLAPIEAELRRREPIFHKPELGTTRADLEAQTADDFWEVGHPDTGLPPCVSCLDDDSLI
jgi:hypothetical protein